MPIRPLTSHSRTLECHSSTPTTVVRCLDVQLKRAPLGRLAFTFSLEADLRQLRLPPLCPPHRADQLWQHTCFEAFVAATGTPAYYELNFAPSCEWAIYAFRRYRDRAPLSENVAAPALAVRQSGDRFELDAAVALDELSAAYVHSPLQLGLSAVIEEAGGILSYWALRHPPGKPDFHHPDAFTLPLSPPGVDSPGDPG